MADILDGRACEKCQAPLEPWHVGPCPACKVEFIACPWESQHASFMKGAASCPACRGSGRIEAL